MGKRSGVHTTGGWYALCKRWGVATVKIRSNAFVCHTLPPEEILLRAGVLVEQRENDFLITLPTEKGEPAPIWYTSFMGWAMRHNVQLTTVKWFYGRSEEACAELHLGLHGWVVVLLQDVAWENNVLRKGELVLTGTRSYTNFFTENNQVFALLKTSQRPPRADRARSLLLLEQHIAKCVYLGREEELTRALKEWEDTTGYTPTRPTISLLDTYSIKEVLYGQYES